MPKKLTDGVNTSSEPLVAMLTDPPVDGCETETMLRDVPVGSRSFARTFKTFVDESSSTVV